MPLFSTSSNTLNYKYWANLFIWNHSETRLRSCLRAVKAISWHLIFPSNTSICMNTERRLYKAYFGLLYNTQKTLRSTITFWLVAYEDMIMLSRIEQWYYAIPPCSLRRVKKNPIEIDDAKELSSWMRMGRRFWHSVREMWIGHWTQDKTHYDRQI